MSFRVRLLGTGPSQGVPHLGGTDEAGEWGACDPAEPRNRRGRTSALIETPDGTRILVDAGPDIRAQLLAARIARIDHVIITHSHADHVMGLDELRQVNRTTGHALPLHAMEETLADLTTRFAYAFQPPTPGFFRPSLTPHTVRPGQELLLGGVEIGLIEQDHHVMRTLGLRIGGFAYCTDLVRLPAASLAALDGIDTWVVGCFSARPHPVHAHLDQARDWARSLGARRTILTHMSNGLDFATLRSTLTDGLEPGFDGMEITLA